MSISKDDPIELLSVATKNQLFQFNGNLYEQVDGVAMASPLGPLMANAFMCSVEEKLARAKKALVRDLSDATDLLACLNEVQPPLTLRWKKQPTIDCHSLAWKSSKSTAASKPAFTERKQIKDPSSTTKSMLTPGLNGRC